MNIITWGVIIVNIFVQSTSHRPNIYLNKWVALIKHGPYKADQIAKIYGFRNIGTVGSLRNYYLFEHQRTVKRSVRPSLQYHRKLTRHPDVIWAEQQVMKIRVKRDGRMVKRRREATPWNPNFNDSWWPKQWYLHGDAAGKYDMNVVEAWKRGFTGRGVVVTILDDGIELKHPDLVQNYDGEASYDINGYDDDPTPSYDSGDENKHGTRCAGEVAAAANNSLCSVGIAYNAKIGGVRMLDGEVSDYVESIALSLNPNHIDIYSASWGPDDDGRVVDGPGHLAMTAFLNGISYGRQGRGSIFVWASGNGGSLADSCSCDGYTNSVFTLSVSSTSEHGTKPWYLEECASTLATTYSSGENYRDRKIITTDIRNRCTDQHTGTSASAPLAAGIIALALQANPLLTWRDVQHIVLLTARTEPLIDADWVFNGLNRKVSHKYGYGLMDAAAIVSLSEKWVTVPSQRVCHSEVIRLDEPLKDVRSSFRMVSSACDGSAHSIRYLEHVQANITVYYSRRGDLQLHLISPSGTHSTILPRRKLDDDERSGFVNWPFMSVFYWGEDPRGLWELVVENTGSESNRGTLVQWQLILYGTLEYPYNYEGALKPPSTTTTKETESVQSSVAKAEDVTETLASTMAINTEVCSPLCAPNEGCSGPNPENCKLCRRVRIGNNGPCAESCPENSVLDASGMFCQLCPSPCQTCQNSAGNLLCLSCETGFKLTTTNLCVRDCPSNSFFDTLTEECLLCEPECLTCAVSSGFCLSCHSEHELVERSRCLRKCLPQHYRDREKRCQPCHASCQTCNGPSVTNCMLCPNDMPNENGACVSQCSEGFYKEYLSSGLKCLRCHEHCRTCFGASSDSCLSCGQGMRLRVSECLPMCSIGEFELLSNGECVPCHLSCASCHGIGSSDCRTCASNRVYIEGQCLDNCPENYFISQSDGMSVCVECDAHCDKCSGPNKNQCTSCSVDLVLIDGQCLSSCQLGEYRDDALSCQQCDGLCTSCNGPGEDSCTSCPNNFYLLHHSCVERCPLGFYSNVLQDTARCLQCSNSLCAQCTAEEPMVCVACYEHYVLQLPDGNCIFDNASISFHNGSNLVSCESGQYLNSIEQMCHHCPVECLECHNDSVCTKCATDYRYHSDLHRCLPCCAQSNSAVCCSCDREEVSDGGCLMFITSIEPITSEIMTTPSVGSVVSVIVLVSNVPNDDNILVSEGNEFPVAGEMISTQPALVTPHETSALPNSTLMSITMISTASEELHTTSGMPFAVLTESSISLLVLRIDKHTAVFVIIIFVALIFLALVIVAIMLRRKARGHPCCCSEYQPVPTGPNAIYVNGRDDVELAKYPPTYTVIS